MKAFHACGLWIATLVACANAWAQALPEPSEGFLCCNMRIEDGWISDSNFRSKGSQLVPAGTPIKATGYGRQRVKVLVAGKSMELGNDYSRKLDLRTFAQRYIVAQDPTERLKDTPLEIRDAIRLGQVLPGMTREQVLMSLGYPVLDNTPDLQSKTWKLAIDSDHTYSLVFDDAGTLQIINGDDQTLAEVAPTLLSKERLAAATAGEQACEVNVYRPESKHWNTSRVRPYLYVDDKKVGTLALGETYCLHLDPGTHTIETKETLLMFVPAITSGKQQVNVRQGGAPVFLRYTKDLGDAVSTGKGIVFTENNQFGVATEAQWRARE